MAYQSVDKLQNLLADEIFNYTIDKKKASGRALGTFIEVITYYLIKNWKLETYAAIERPLPEFANDDITHNVEFTLHGRRILIEAPFTREDFPISGNTIRKKHVELGDDSNKKPITLIDKNGTIRNACNIAEKANTFINIYLDSAKMVYEACELLKNPFAMFECKRVGVEEGTRKGPQTIEKAKQGSYVAKAVSSLQKIRMSDGTIGGLIHKPNNTFVIEEYYSLLDKVINSDDPQFLKNFILTIGVVSNHGNWFTSDNPNKELRVLAQSYDWLLFLTDNGISEFITDLLIEPSRRYSAIKKAFNQSYNAKKVGNVFTKVKMDFEADIALNTYFQENREKIESWFNVISPKRKSLAILRRELMTLTQKDWWRVYA